MKDFANFIAGEPHERVYTKICGPTAWTTTDSVVYLSSDSRVYKRFLGSSEVATPVTEGILRMYHKIHKVLSKEKICFHLPLRRVDIEASVLPLEQEDILVSGGQVLSRASYIDGKTLNEESASFIGKFGVLGFAVLSGIRDILGKKGVIIDTADCYIHPTNVKVDPQSYTSVTVTDLGAKIPAFVAANRHLIEQ